MAPTLQSPNVDNYFIGKGNVYFTETGLAERHLGNVPNFVMTPSLDTLEHFSSMGGIRSKDLEIILSQSITLAITLEEFTPANIALALLGTVDEDAVGGPTVEIFSRTSVRGAIRFDGTNLYGAQMLVKLHNVAFTPQADVGLITDELGQIELEAAVSAAPVTDIPNAGKFGSIQFKNVAAST